MYSLTKRPLARLLPIALLLVSACADDGSESEAPISPIVTADSGALPPVMDAAPSAAVDTGTPMVTPPRDAGGNSQIPDAGVFDAMAIADAGLNTNADAAPIGDAGPVDSDGGGSVAPGDAIQRGPADKAYISKNGPYTTKSYTSGFKDGANFAGATIYYPDHADAKPPFAYVAICPGFTAAQSSIAGWGPFLASHGIIAMTIDTNDPLVDMAARSKALADALASVAGENTRMGSPLVGKIDVARKGSMGWSMGGGGTMLLAEQDKDLKAAISLCGYHPSRDFGKVSTPSLLFTATGDTTASPGSNALGWYPDLKCKKMLFEVQGGSHFSANSPTGTGGQIGAYGLAWLKIFLEGDERYIPIAKAMPTGGIAMFQTNL
jgi:dienelactone hydrolase